MNWENQLTKLLGIRYPVVQAPMLGITSPAMVAAIAEQGGLGSLPVGGLPAEKTAELIRKTKALTSRPFAVNLFAHAIPPVDKDTAARMRGFLQQLGAENGLQFDTPQPEALRFHSYTEQVPVLLEERIPFVSFTFGLLNDATVETLKRKGVILTGTATSVKEARLLDERDTDIITTQGFEAGGHRGSFLEQEPLPQVGTMALVSLVTRNVKRPVLAAGGIHDGRTLRAALMLGAAGVQVGSAFIACEESLAAPAHKERVRNAADTDSVLTRSFTGRWARGLRNPFLDALENAGIAIPEYPVQNNLIAALRTAAQQQGNTDYLVMLAGQAAAGAGTGPAAEIFRALVNEAESI